MVRAVLAYQEHGVEFFQLSGQSWIGIPELSTFFDPKKRGGGGGGNGTRQSNICILLTANKKKQFS